MPSPRGAGPRAPCERHARQADRGGARHERPRGEQDRCSRSGEARRSRQGAARAHPLVGPRGGVGSRPNVRAAQPLHGVTSGRPYHRLRPGGGLFLDCLTLDIEPVGAGRVTHATLASNRHEGWRREPGTSASEGFGPGHGEVDSLPRPRVVHDKRTASRVRPRSARRVWRRMRMPRTCELVGSPIIGGASCTAAHGSQRHRGFSVGWCGARDEGESARPSGSDRASEEGEIRWRVDVT